MLKVVRETIIFETESGEARPIELVESTSFCRFVLRHNNLIPSEDDIRQIFEYLGASLESLEKYAWPEGPPLEDQIYWYGDSEYIRKSWQARIANDEAAWKSPDEIIKCIKPVIEALNKQKDIFSGLGIEREYFVAGYFEQDLTSLLRIAEWARACGINRVRLRVSDGITNKDSIKKEKERVDKIRDPDGDMPPPWLVFPHYNPSSVGWRMGVGESYMIRWHLEYARFDGQKKKSYKKKYPVPLYWFYFYWPSGNILMQITVIFVVFVSLPFRLIFHPLYRARWSLTGKTVKYL